MSTPNRKVLEALLEVYLATRMNKGSWSISEIDANTLTAAAKPGDRKLEICKKLASTFDSTYSTYNWIDVAIELSKLEMDERNEPNKSWLSYFHTPSMLLADTLKASRSYILYSLANDSYFKERCNSLEENKVRLNKELATLKEKKEPEEVIKKKEADISLVMKEIEALSTKQDHHHAFYTKTIKTIDPKVGELNENTFEDFVKSVEEGKRPNTYLNKLTEAVKQADKLQKESEKAAQPPVLPDTLFAKPKTRGTKQKAGHDTYSYETSPINRRHYN